MDGFGCGGRLGGREDVVELAPRVCPTCGFDDASAFVERMKSRIGVGLRGSTKALEMSFRMFAATIWREGEPGRRRRCISACRVREAQTGQCKTLSKIRGAKTVAVEIEDFRLREDDHWVLAGRIGKGGH